MKKFNTTIIVFAVAITLFAVNILSSKHWLRVDLTENQEYSLSESAKNVLATLDDIVTIRVYFSPDLPPTLLTLQQQTQDLLSEFKQHAGANLQVEFRNPQESGLEEQKVNLLGIPPVQLNVMDKDKQSVAKVYLGIAVLFADKQEVLPVVTQAANLEYDLLQAILKVSTAKQPSVAWWSGEAFAGEIGSGFGIIQQQLRKRYQLSQINDDNLETLQTTSFNTLVLASPGELSDKALFAIDQFLMNGGRVIALLDRWNIDGSLKVSARSSKLNELLTHYGITVDDGFVLDRSNAMAQFASGHVSYQLPYPFWPQVRKENFNQEVAMVANLEGLILPWASKLVVADSNQDKTIEVLAKTTRFGATANNSAEAPLRLDPEGAGEVMRSAQQKVVPLAAQISGKILSAYGENGVFKKAPKKSFASISSDGAQILVLGTSRFIQDRFLQMFQANLLFFENALDSYAWGDQLIGIRSRSSLTRPIALLSQGAMLGLRYFNILLGPLLVFGLGAIVWFIRRSRHRALRLAYR